MGSEKGSINTSNILCGNIEGLLPHKNKYKVKMLEEKALLEEIKIIALVETHLRPEICDAEIRINGFTCFRQDRANDVKKGGVCIYVSDELARDTEIMSSGSVGNLEWATIRMHRPNLVLSNIYRPPVCDMVSFGEYLKYINIDISACGCPEPTIFIFGDFNFPIIDWETKILRSSGRPDRSQAEKLLEFMDERMLDQIVRLPTREENILDLVLTNNDEMINDINIEYTSISDH